MKLSGLSMGPAWTMIADSPTTGVDRQENHEMNETLPICRPRRAVLAMGLVLAGLATSVPALADGYPSKPIKIIVPFTAGSATDTAGRVLASALGPRLGVPIVVENRAGAGGTIGAAGAAAAPADGYTLILTSSSTHSAASALVQKVPYDGAEDFAHIVRIANIPLMLVVRSDAKARTVAALRDASRTQSLNYAYGSATSQIAAATFNSVAGVNAVGVPYKSQPPAVTDLLGGQVDFLFADLSVVKSFISGGRLTGVALSAPARSKEFPAVPTLQELGFKNFDLVVWVGLAAPKDTPREVVQKLAQEAGAVLKDGDTVAKLSASGMEVAPNTLEEHRRFVQEQKRIWTARAQAAGVKPE